MGLQFRNGLVGPVGVFDFVQLGLWESVVEILYGHLVEGDHVLKLIQLGVDKTERKNNRVFKCKSIKMFMRYYRNQSLTSFS